MLVHVVAVGAHGVDALGVDHDRVGMGGCEAPAARRAAGLGDHRPALRAGPGIEGAAGLEVLALVVHAVDLGVVDQVAALAVGHHRARLPRAPQAAHHLHVFVRHVVAQVVLGHAGHAEVHRREVGAAGDGIPAGAAGRHLVERRHEAGQQIGVVGVGAEGGDDADARGHLGHQRGHHRRILPRHRDGLLQVDLGRAAETLAHVRGILEEDVVEAGPLQAARHVEEQLGLLPGRPDMPGPGLPPGLHTGALQEPREMKWVGRHERPPMPPARHT